MQKSSIKFKVDFLDCVQIDNNKILALNKGNRIHVISNSKKIKEILTEKNPEKNQEFQRVFQLGKEQVII